MDFVGANSSKSALHNATKRITKVHKIKGQQKQSKF